MAFPDCLLYYRPLLQVFLNLATIDTSYLFFQVFSVEKLRFEAAFKVLHFLLPARLNQNSCLISFYMEYLSFFQINFFAIHTPCYYCFGASLLRLRESARVERRESTEVYLHHQQFLVSIQLSTELIGMTMKTAKVSTLFRFGETQFYGWQGRVSHFPCPYFLFHSVKGRQ